MIDWPSSIERDGKKHYDWETVFWRHTPEKLFASRIQEAPSKLKIKNKSDWITDK